MAANVVHNFDGFFELDEERLRRIHSIVKNRINDTLLQHIEFRVTRLDNLIYSTKKIDDVINEKNDSVSKIISIEIYYIDEQNNITILFENKGGVSMKITGDDRDTVFLLSSELKEYIKKEISIAHYIRFINTKLFAILAGTACLIAFIFIMITTPNTDNSTLNDLLKSQDTNSKINFIIEQLIIKKQTPSHIVMLPFMFALILITLPSPLIKTIKYLFPVNTFIIGKQVEHIQKRKKLRSNIFWVIFVGSLLSLAVAYISPKLFG